MCPPASGNVGLGSQIWLDEVGSQVAGYIEVAIRVAVLWERQASQEILQWHMRLPTHCGWLFSCTKQTLCFTDLRILHIMFNTTLAVTVVGYQCNFFCATRNISLAPEELRPVRCPV